MNDENELNPPVLDGYTKIPTFKLWVANNFPYMETDFDGITNYDLMGALTDYLNNVIQNEENVESNVAKLNQAYLELFNYVKDYFDNLDVQEEINNKLDDLVADGTLTRLIGEYVQPLIDEQNQEIAEFKTSVNGQIASQNAQIQAVTSGSPLVASSVNDMTDTTRVYVNTTDGNWYYYNGSQWTIGGVYQSTQLGDNAVEVYNFGSSLKDKFPFETIEINHNYLAVGGFTVNSTTNYINENSNTNRAKCPRQRIQMGDILNFNDNNGEYKISVALGGSDGYIYEYLKFSEYDSSLYPYVIKKPQAEFLYVQFAKADDSTIEDINIFDDLFTIERPLIYNNTGSTIKEDSISLSQIDNIETNTNNICPSKILNYSYDSNTRRINKNLNYRSRLLKVYGDIHYYVKVFGTHNRFRIIGLYDYPVFNENNYMSINGSTGGVIINNDSLSEYDFICPKKYKYILIVYNSGSDNADVMVSKTPIDGFENYSISVDGLDIPSIENQNYTLPNSFTDTLIFQATTYLDTHEMQSICTDGTYLYYGMHGTTDNDVSVIGKIRLSDNQLILEKADYSYKHCNGMCYDPNNNQLLIVGLDSDDTIFRVNADTLEYISSFSLKNIISSHWNAYSYGTYKGLGGIAYSTNLEKFVVLIRKNDNNNFFGFAILDKDFNLEKLIKEPTRQGTRGDIETDEKFIYLCYPNNNGNDVLVYDYNGNYVDYIRLNDVSVNGFVKISPTLYYMSLSWEDRIYKCEVTSTKEKSKLDTLTNFNYN